MTHPRRKRASVAAVGLRLLALAAAAPALAHAQTEIDPAQVAALAAESLGVTTEEMQAFTDADAGRHIRARELAERILARDARSYVAHLALGLVQHYGEANLPRSLFHLTQARSLYEARYGSRSGPEQPWRWHATLLKELATVYGDMEQHEKKLELIAVYNELYEPDMVADRAWPLMKLGRHAEARLAADLGLASDRTGQRVVALNALCAIEFEAGNDGASYGACKRAVDESAERGGLASAVDLTNFAEASRSLFKLDEAERVALEATAAQPSWYGNPWMELGELYTRQGRFGEALDALRKMPEYRMQRPPHVRDVDRGETRRVLASFLLVMGKADDAIDVTARAIAAPDRRAHNSRDPAQDDSVTALLDRAARLTASEQVLERAATEAWYSRPRACVEALGLRLQARRSAARIGKLLEDDARLSGIFRIGQASAAIVPPWLVSDLVHVLGAGVAEAASERARAKDTRPGAAAYYDAVAAEIAWARGDARETLALAQRSLAALGPAEVLLAARLHAIAADAARQAQDWDRARLHYDAAFQRDPGVLRRLGLPVAVRTRTSGALGAEVADMLERSPRFERSADGLALTVEADRAQARACLSGGAGQVITCAEVEVRTAPADLPWTSYVGRELLRQLFAPRVDLSQTDIHSLDGQNLSGRDSLRGVLD